MRSYIDEFTLGDLLGILIRFPQILYNVVKEELYWWLTQYKYEFTSPYSEKDDRKALEKSRKRMRKGS